MSECTCRTDPLFYWVWVDPIYSNSIGRMCLFCIDIYHPTKSIDQVFNYYNSGSTKAFKTLEELELYRIKQRL